MDNSKTYQPRKKSEWKQAKELALITSIITVILYLSIRVVFSDFETTILEETWFFGRVFIASAIVVLATAGLVLLIRRLTGTYYRLQHRRSYRKQLSA